MIQTTTQAEATTTGSAIVGGPARIKNRDGRIRDALGIGGSYLPRVQIRWLRNYYEHLATRLQVPFQARYAGDLRCWQPATALVTVAALLDPGTDSQRESTGLLCEVRCGEEKRTLPLVDLEVEESSPNFQLIEDYWYWFWNWRFDPRI